MGWLEANPCANLRKMKENGPRRIVLNSEEIAEIVERRHRSESDRILYFMLLTGQRGGECKEVQGQTYQYSTVGEHFPLSTPKENAALKRSSMDLSRALAQIRKY
jgi:hypothetical protein